ncbi:MAG: uroporphyrinogen decarboxylase [Alteromonas sp.]|jgi:uroporphyrinogen decarboxylase|uniref:uroporphyrinogen decarboxylase n=1 Tax=unclassified Alteromonas TaxID=2614992 RepID=UPI0009041C23|nr:MULTISPECIES: uroporphyrinogen decarboxylase [unclassified Alteromonas]APE07234.1 uroporphyrinogen decarboxylase [Alteromonas sp. RW2A1]AUC89854.1 uroporphyrinogen decarboxylase [Alteromonas sp. MB-3u-76]MAI63584.1 uroporphyrinogen decarboxylase [Alteromonas sp.]
MSQNIPNVDKPALKNDRYLRALQKQPVDVTPVWMMRQAGRYLPEYKATRAVAGDFMSLCKNAELACEVTLQPLRRFPLDAAILFSDILTIPDAMGLELYFETGEGPRFKKPITCKADVDKIGIPDPEGELQYVMNAVRTIRRELKGEVPLIGFSGSPWTLATYMVEGGSSKAFTKIKKMAFAEPAILHTLLAKLADSVTSYLNAQIAAGAQSVMIFDTWGGVLSPRDYKEFSLQYMERIVNGLTRENEGRKVPVTLFTKNGGMWLESIAATGCDAVGLDWTIDIKEARARIGDKVALQGNMDPSMLYAPAQRIEEEVSTILEGYGEGSGHVFNLGHGIHLDVPPENAGVFVNAVHELSKPYHK